MLNPHEDVYCCNESRFFPITNLDSITKEKDVSKLFVIVFPQSQIIDKIWVSCILK